MVIMEQVGMSQSQAETGMRFPETSSRLLSRKEALHRGVAKLRYSINELYARHGVDFEDRKIKKWFLQFKWYHPGDGSSDDSNKLTHIEEENLQTLRSAGCELGDKSGDTDELLKQPLAGGLPKTNMPVNASVVDNPPAIDEPQARYDYGSIEVEFADGHKERWTKENHCSEPHVSNKGDVGWVYGNLSAPPPGSERRIGIDLLVVRLANGKTRKFQPHREGPFIECWTFADHDSAVLIKSRANHGTASYIKYNIKSGQVLGHMSGYLEWEKMPRWAWPFGDE